MLTINKLVDYTIPLFGNRHCQPYGKLIINGSIGKKICPIRENKWDGSQFITYNRKRFYIKNAGDLYYPFFVFEKTNAEWEVE